MISLATETERTLFFDFLPLALGSIRGFKVRFHLYTVPGQVFYDASRKLILKRVLNPRISPSESGKKSKNSVRSVSVASEIILPFASGFVLL